VAIKPSCEAGTSHHVAKVKDSITFQAPKYAVTLEIHMKGWLVLQASLKDATLVDGGK
jgi:hypothetical protein